MFSIALIGLDGAGKTTVTRKLGSQLPAPVRHIYMGVSTSSSNRLLPTTRLAATLKRKTGSLNEWEGPPDPTRPKPKPQGLVKGTLSGIRAVLRLANRIAEECYRQALTWYYQARGNIVLYDRHFFFDYYFYDIIPTSEKRPVTRALHGWFLKHVYPRPDLTIFLDAPAEVVFARKGEGTIESLERRRQEYLHMRNHVQHFAVVDATLPPETVLDEVTKIIWDFYRSRAGKNGKVENAHG